MKNKRKEKNADAKDNENRTANRKYKTPGSSQRLDLFIKVLRVLCPNLPDASFFFHFSNLWEAAGNENKCPKRSMARILSLDFGRRNR